MSKNNNRCGGSGIRTPGTLSGTSDFKSDTFDHSVKPLMFLSTPIYHQRIPLSIFDKIF